MRTPDPDTIMVPQSFTLTKYAVRWYRTGFVDGFKGLPVNGDVPPGFDRRGYTLRAYLAGFTAGQSLSSRLRAEGAP